MALSWFKLFFSKVEHHSAGDFEQWEVRESSTVPDRTYGPDRRAYGPDRRYGPAK